jgi:hypothetical protein
MRERGHGHGSNTGTPRQYAVPDTKSQLNAQDAYAFWIVGFVLLCTVVAAAAKQNPPSVQLPRPSADQVATTVAWLLIAAVVAGVLLTHRG